MRLPVILAALLVLAAPARAATFEAVKLSDGRAAIRMSGDIVPGDGLRFAQATKASPAPVALVLTGEGGNADAAMKIGMTLRMMEMETVIPEGGLCASACALTWAAGAPMAVGQGARIGFHGAYLPDAQVPQRSEAGSALIGVYLSRLGFEDTAVSYMTAAAPQNMRWLSGKDAADMHFRIVRAPTVVTE